VFFRLNFKRLLVFSLVAVLLLPLWQVMPQASGGETYPLGDINLDGQVDIDDILSVRAHLFGTVPLSGDELAAALVLVPDSTDADIDTILIVRELIFGLYLYEVDKVLVPTWDQTANATFNPYILHREPREWLRVNGLSEAWPKLVDDIMDSKEVLSPADYGLTDLTLLHKMAQLFYNYHIYRGFLTAMPLINSEAGTVDLSYRFASIVQNQRMTRFALEMNALLPDICPPQSNELDRIFAIHLYLTGSADIDWSDRLAWSDAYTVLDSRTRIGECCSYADAEVFLLTQCAVEARRVTDYKGGTNWPRPSTVDGLWYHGWLQIRVNGVYYNADVERERKYNGKSGGVTCLLLTDAEMETCAGLWGFQADYKKYINFAPLTPVEVPAVTSRTFAFLHDGQLQDPYDVSLFPRSDPASHTMSFPKSVGSGDTLDYKLFTYNTQTGEVRADW